MLEAAQLGASLYMPAYHHKLLDVANGQQPLRSVIFCTEDAVAAGDLDRALDNLAATLLAMTPDTPLLRFVRVRNPAVLARVLTMPGADKLTGFVLPKITCLNFEAYFTQVAGTRHLLMPTLETTEVFDDQEMRALRDRLLAENTRSRILALRIGGNDLLALLGIRRPRETTLYRTPLGQVIARLVTTFRPHGFALTAPVFEYLDRPALLSAEVEEDLAHGLFSKAAIHPEQVPLIEHHYQVGPIEVEMARSILDADSPAVFRMHDAMCEVATHRSWAQVVLERAVLFGLKTSVEPAHAERMN